MDPVDPDPIRIRIRFGSGSATLRVTVCFQPGQADRVVGLYKYKVIGFAGDSAAAEPVPAAGGRGLRRLVHGPAPPSTHPRTRSSQQVR